MGQPQYEIFDMIARKRFRATLRNWLRQTPRRVHKVLGESHRIIVRWNACPASERTNGIAVIKLRSDDKQAPRLFARLNAMTDWRVHKEGRNSYFLFVFYRSEPRPRRTSR